MFSYYIEQKAVQLLLVHHLAMIGDLHSMLLPMVQLIHMGILGPMVTAAGTVTLPKMVM